MEPGYDAPHRNPNPQILDAAEQYFNAYVILNKAALEKALEALQAGVVLPQLNSGVIAVELYLKCLAAEDVYVQEELTPVTGVHRIHAKALVHNHKLGDLLKAIPVDIQSLLVDAFESSALRRWASSFEELLSQFEGLFMASRYPFEEGTRHISYPSDNCLLALLHFLREFIKDLSRRS